MKRFKFQFETLEKVRRSREDEVLRALSVAQSAYSAAQQRKTDLRSALENSLIRREDLGTHPVGALDFLLENDFIDGTRQRIIQADQGILRARRSVEKALRNYLHARRQTRMMEMLREKAYGEFKIARNKHEQKQLDDLSVMRNRLKIRESA